MSDEQIVLNPKKRGLGRGLDALFESDEKLYHAPSSVPAAQTAGSAHGLKMMAIETLRPGVNQPRKEFKPEMLADLAASIKTHGIVQPLLVRPVGTDQFEIIAGERRWRAAQLAQLHEVPVTIREMDDAEALQIGLIENLQRENLNPVEEALGFQRLIEEFGFTQQVLAEKIGKSRSAITNTLRLLALPQSVRDMVQAGTLSAGHARALIGKENAEDLAQNIIAQGLSVRDIEAMTHQKPAVDSGVPSSLKMMAKDSDLLALEKELSELLGMTLDLSLKPGGQKGQMKIAFKSLEQLDYVLNKLRA